VLNMSRTLSIAMRPESAQTEAGLRHGLAQAGFTLIEVLVALLVLSVGLLGLAALQQNAVRFNYDAHLASQATTLAYDIADRIRGNRQAALANAYDSVFAAMPPACNAAIAAGTVVAQDIAAWRRALTCALPAGNGEIDWDGPSEILTITVRWDPSRGAVAAEAEQFVMTTGL
jgi:type IV pilus assembly protein PilV